jgi:hypothetical protein
MSPHAKTCPEAESCGPKRPHAGDWVVEYYSDIAIIIVSNEMRFQAATIRFGETFSSGESRDLL